MLPTPYLSSLTCPTGLAAQRLGCPVCWGTVLICYVSARLLGDG